MRSPPEERQVHALALVALHEVEGLRAVVLVGDEERRAVAAVGHARDALLAELRLERRLLLAARELAVHVLQAPGLGHVLVDVEAATVHAGVGRREPEVEVHRGGVGVQADAVRVARGVLEEPEEAQRVLCEALRAERRLDGRGDGAHDGVAEAVAGEGAEEPIAHGVEHRRGAHVALELRQRRIGQQAVDDHELPRVILALDGAPIQLRVEHG
eukprot:CAMPEP_0118873352 /NCGR_PEP_ID=MMETSP1163-20130328/15181_1 /TAXON_ID=124430 /ORGANISM="Phaeomonas parva, Strain CCMP2877" /LENGTH=213 /DNA_ID=CAMNT_0006808617 /DNA_START=245 /DNA_END=881 /DNA_ORIENTATION=-